MADHLPRPRVRKVDAIDRQILNALQRNADLSVAALAEEIHLSHTPCWKRIRRLEREGVITGRVALIAPEKIGLGLTVFVALEAGDRSVEWQDTLEATLAAMPEVMDIYRLSGEADYMLRVVVADMAAFDGFYKRLIQSVHLGNVTSRFAMERIKSTTVLPIQIPNGGRRLDAEVAV